MLGMPTLNALIFDVDGTLAETERDGHRVAFNRAFADAGLEWNWSVEHYRDLLEVAGGKERIQFFLDTDCPTFQPNGNLREWIASLHRAKTDHYQKLVADGLIPLRPGVKRLIQEAREQGVRLAIATTSRFDNVTALLETTLGPDSPNWFEIIGAGDVVPAKKPAPDIYFYVLDKLQLPPQECLAIEDSHQGLQAAMAAGITTIVTFNRYTQHHDFSGALLVLDHLGEPDLPFQPVDPLPIASSLSTATHLTLALARELLQVGASEQ